MGVFARCGPVYRSSLRNGRRHTGRHRRVSRVCPVGIIRKGSNSTTSKWWHTCSDENHRFPSRGRYPCRQRRCSVRDYRGNILQEYYVGRSRDLGRRDRMGSASRTSTFRVHLFTDVLRLARGWYSRRCRYRRGPRHRCLM